MQARCDHLHRASTALESMNELIVVPHFTYDELELESMSDLVSLETGNSLRHTKATSCTTPTVAKLKLFPACVAALCESAHGTMGTPIASAVSGVQG